MKLDANNNGRIIYRIARSNLTGSKVYTLFSGLTIILSITFIMVMSLFLQGTQTAEERMLKNMQHVLYINVPRERIEELATDERTELSVGFITHTADRAASDDRNDREAASENGTAGRGFFRCRIYGFLSV